MCAIMGGKLCQDCAEAQFPRDPPRGPVGAPGRRVSSDPLDLQLSTIRAFLEGRALPDERRRAPAALPAPAPLRAGAVEAPPPAPRVVVSEDHLRAWIDRVPADAEVEALIELLHAHDVSTGILHEALDAAVRQARRDGPQLDVLVAEAAPPRPPGPPRPRFQLPEGLAEVPDLAPLAAALGGGGGLAAAAGDRHWPVRPGSVLAVRTVEPGEVGVDLRGRVIPVPPAPAPQAGDLPDAGPGVTYDQAAGTWRATRFGYAGYLAGALAVLLPVGWAEDDREAWLLTLPAGPLDPPPTAEAVAAALAEAGVAVAPDPEALEGVRQALVQGGAARHLVALAEAPVPPEPAVPRFSFAHTFRPGTLRADGSTDFRRRNLFPSVTEGALLAELRPAVPGRPGRTVRGAPIPPPPADAVELVALQGVRRVDREGVQRLFAETDGGATVRTEARIGSSGVRRRYLVAVRAVIDVAGDVGYRTGNLDFRGNVRIHGDVRAGFTVKTTGDVYVGGMIDAGAAVEAGGDVFVRGNVLGPETRVVAGGDVTAVAIQAASIRAGGSVQVARYIHESRVQASRAVVVAGEAERRGGIVGGETWAGDAIRTRNAGSVWNATTLLAVGTADPPEVERLESAERSAEAAARLLKRLCETLGVEALDADRIRVVLARQPQRAKDIMRALQAARDLAAAREQHLATAALIRQTLAAQCLDAAVEVTGWVHGGVTVRVGERCVLLRHDLAAVRFSLDPGGEVGGVVWSHLSAAGGSIN